MKRITFISLILFFLLSITVSVHAAIPASERAALIAIYNSFNGNNWTDNSGWKTPPLSADGFAMTGTEGNWKGITVVNDHVDEIYFYFLGIKGSLSPEVTALTNLRGLRILQLYGFTGDLMPELSQLTNLERLHLYGKDLSGTFPIEWINLKKLQWLAVTGETITGTIPPELSTLTQLRNLTFSQCDISGSIPPELGQLSNLEELFLSDTQLSGTIPAELGNLSSLRRLVINRNSISGTIPPELGNLSNLRILDIGSNDVGGAIPPELGNLSNLEGLYLGANLLSGTIPVELSRLGKLNDLYIGLNNVSGAIPPELGDLPSLENMNIYSTDVSGEIPPELGNIKTLKYLTLTRNKLSGTLPAELGNLTNLLGLNLYRNQFTGAIPDTFRNLTKLRWLSCSSNNFTGNIPAYIGTFSDLESLWLDLNNFSGTIPPQLGNCAKLYSLALSSNHLEGTIPPQLGSCVNLETLRLQYNHLEGTIPAELGNLVKLTDFSVASNKLEGQIPVTMKNLNKLTDTYSIYTFDYNMLYSQDAALNTWLENNNANWYKTQTLPPTGPSALALDHSSVRVTWSPIIYSGGIGGYRVYYSLTPGGPWTYAGMTADKSANSFDVTGLLPGTTYYFVVATQSDNYNTLVSGYCEEVSATTAMPAGTFILNVQSFPYTGIGVTVSPSDFSGNGTGSTNFTRLYNDGTVVTLTAPASYSGNNFLYWAVDGVDNSNSTIQVTMNVNHTVIAVYEQVSPPETYTLTVQSSPDSGATVTVAPGDNNGNGTGTTTFTRTYNEGTSVTLTVPAEYNGKVFSKWLIDGAANTAQTVTVTMDANHSATAVYEEDDPPPPGEYTLTVESTTGSGAAITVSPSDNNGESNGSTKFTRTYDSGTVVTLTAPAEHKNQEFAYWKIDNVIRSNSQTVEFTITGDHKAKAFYTTASRPGLVLSRGRINFGYEIGDALPPTQTLRVTINGTPVDWSAAVDVTWLVLGKTSGTGTAEIALSINPDGLTEGKYDGVITVTAPDADNSPQTAKVTLTVYGSNGTAEPIGDFSTPLDGSTVSSSVPVTGWVVDDLGIENVKIYREGKNAKDLIYIGDAVFVEGARPDVEELFPDYPGNYQAGWGYMLLTNFFPEGGNGTFVLHAIATDVEGNSVTLGTKTITCDNANAVKPFGAIDTPTQGGIASGSSFINWGWVLTPQPNSIPTDGSTIDVYVDGVKLGHPNYNIYREDIATFFPGYANSDGAIGYYILDTTLYEDGIHTIQWVAKDSAGNTDGIGSRFFTIDNSGIARSQANVPSSVASVPFPVVGVQFIEPAKGDRPEISIDTRELEPLEIHLEGRIVGHSKLPVGSTLDRENGTFYWSPGVGFVGEYSFTFVEETQGGRLQRKTVKVGIAPRFKK